MTPYNYILHSGIKSGRSILIEDGALPWIVQNANNEAAPIRRHIELALCHLAQHGNVTSHDCFSVFQNTLLKNFKQLRDKYCRSECERHD